MFDESKYKCYGYDEKNEDGSVRCHCVVAISTYAGKPVKGYAKCHPDDAWDWERVRPLPSHAVLKKLLRREPREQQERWLKLRIF